MRLSSPALVQPGGPVRHEQKGRLVSPLRIHDHQHHCPSSSLVDSSTVIFIDTRSLPTAHCPVDTRKLEAPYPSIDIQNVTTPYTRPYLLHTKASCRLNYDHETSFSRSPTRGGSLQEEVDHPPVSTTVTRDVTSLVSTNVRLGPATPDRKGNQCQIRARLQGGYRKVHV